MGIKQFRLLDQRRLQALLLGGLGSPDPVRGRTTLYWVEGDVPTHALSTLAEKRSGLLPN